LMLSDGSRVCSSWLATKCTRHSCRALNRAGEAGSQAGSRGESGAITRKHRRAKERAWRNGPQPHSQRQHPVRADPF
jgi:hypothetical protein